MEPHPGTARQTARFVGLLATAWLMACDETAMAPAEPSALVIVATDAAETNDHVARTTQRYLTALTSLPTEIVLVASPDAANDAIAAHRPSLVVKLGLAAETLPTEPQPITPGQPPAPFDDRFRVAVETLGTATNPIDGLPGTIAVSLDAHTHLGQQYAVYEMLRRLGARFYHPEDEHLPAIPPEQVRARLGTPTVVGEGPLFTPSFLHRSYSFHGAHPLEHMESFSDPLHPIDEAVNVNTWIVKQRGDIFRGAGRAVVDAGARRERAEALEVVRQTLGLRRSAGITLHNQQQGSSADINPDSEEPIEDQIVRVVTAKLAAAPDAIGFGIHFGPTELTTTPDIPTVDAINLAGRTALSLRPDLVVEINNHTSGSQPVDHFDDLGCPPGTNDRGVSDYYDLAFHTDPAIGVRVHTVMFQPLTGPAGVYNQKSFAHKLCLMQKASAAGRPLAWFPEGSYWLSVDNTIPVYLPLYIATRAADIASLSPLLVTGGDGTVRSHRMFNSGHEWGYWQQDYAVGLMHWRHTLTMDEVLGELGDPLCDVAVWPASCPARDAYVTTLREVMAAQWKMFLDDPDFRGRPGGLYWYFAGEDPADELGAASGLEFRPVRVPFREVARMAATTLADFTSIDLATLDAAHADYLAWVEALDAVRGDVPESGRRWLDETVDGLKINHLRAGHTAALYRAAIALRDGGDPDAAATHLDRARELRADAEDVIAEREAFYRYPIEQVVAGPSVPNGTTYPFRVNYRTHVLAYWTNREKQVEDLIAGLGDDAARVSLTPTFAAPGTPLDASWPALDGLRGTVDIGASLSLRVGDAQLVLPDEPAIFRVEGALETGDGALLPVLGFVVRSEAIRATKKGGFTLVTPDAPVAASVLSAVLPSIRFGLVDDRLAFAIQLDETIDVPFDAISVAALGEAVTPPGGGDARRETAPTAFVLPIPDPASGAEAARVRVKDAIFSVHPTLGDDHVDLDGALSTGDLVDALIELAGFDEEGASATLADVLGLDTLPEWLVFSATMTLAPLP